MSANPRVIIVDTRNASDYERDQIRAVAEWKGRVPGRGALWLGRAAAPLDRAIRSALTEETVEAALAEANKLAGRSFRDDSETKKPADLTEADAAARISRNWAVGYASAGGATAGAAGIAGLVADIPFTVTLALRAIRRIAAAYGYRGEEQAGFALRILAVAAANTAEEKEAALTMLETYIDGGVSSEDANRAATRAAVGKEGAVLATRGLAASLAKNLAGRKAAQAVPIVGAVIGAVASAAFIEDVCTTARHLCQERFMRDRGVLETAIR